MVNLGIVIAVSEYANPDANLPGCKRDGQAIYKILESAGKFSEILYIHADTLSPTVKRQLVEFVGQPRSEEVGDLIFYFTGHGEYIDGDFYYLLSDYEDKKRRQTCLQNSELDGLIRGGLKPNNFVKIVDACYSGISYIKDPLALERYLKSTQASFQNCYFMFSSQQHQTSLQDQVLSDFTRSFISAVVSHPVSNIRYKDIIDHISDEFAGKEEQNPYFVAQAQFTEVFCEVSEGLKSDLRSLLSSKLGEAWAQEKLANETLLEIIRRDAGRYCDEKEALERVSELGALSQQFRLSVETGQLYDLVIQLDTSGSVPNSEKIGQWVESNGRSRGYFAVPVKEAKTVEKRLPTYRWLIPTISLPDQSGTIKITEQVLVGYKSTTELPFKAVLVKAEPKYPNVRAWILYIAVILSRTHLAAFTGTAPYLETSWNARALDGEIKWRAVELSLRQRVELEQFMQSAISELEIALSAEIKSRFLPEVPPGVAPGEPPPAA